MHSNAFHRVQTTRAWMRRAPRARPVFLFIYDAGGADTFFQKRAPALPFYVFLTIRFFSLPLLFSPAFSLSLSLVPPSFIRLYTSLVFNILNPFQFESVVAFRHVTFRYSSTVLSGSLREDILIPDRTASRSAACSRD